MHAVKSKRYSIREEGGAGRRGTARGIGELVPEAGVMGEAVVRYRVEAGGTSNVGRVAVCLATAISKG